MYFFVFVNQKIALKYRDIGDGSLWVVCVCDSGGGVVKLWMNGGGVVFQFYYC
jgi:hypothetical protein